MAMSIGLVPPRSMTPPLVLARIRSRIRVGIIAGIAAIGSANLASLLTATMALSPMAALVCRASFASTKNGGSDEPASCTMMVQ